jgi:excisionase family DNA binding protein
MDKVNTNKQKSGGGSGSLDKVFTLKKASDYLCLSVSTIRKKIKAGHINAIQYQSGGRLMIAESEIMRLRAGYPQVKKAPDNEITPVIHNVVKPAAPAADPLPAPDPVPDAIKKPDNDIEIGVC